MTRKAIQSVTYLLVLAFAVPPAIAQPTPDVTPSDSMLTGTYHVFYPDGRPASLDDVLAAMGEADVVFLGEQHDDPVAHHLQAVLFTDAFTRYGQGNDARSLVLSMEMFERDVQPILDEYLAGLITEAHFLRSSRPWQNYKSDYRSLVEFAKEHHLPVLAANAPRRYVNRVSRLGAASLDSLPPWARAWLPPLPYPGPSPAYVAKWMRLMAEMTAPKEEAESLTPTDSVATPEVAPPDASTHRVVTADSAARPMPAAQDSTEAGSSSPHNGGTMLDAQSFWDAAMAYSIAEQLRAVPGALLMHLGGSFHVEEGLGMPAQLEGYRPGTRRLIIVMKAEDDFASFDAERFGSLGDFIILTDKARPRSFERSAGE